MKSPEAVQELRLMISAVMSVTGIALLMMGFWVAPAGEIHRSVLLAFGEVMTFVGALFGIDYVANKRCEQS